MNDGMEKQIELKALVSRVWRALTDYREFGEWFRVKLEGPFVEGPVSRGRITYPGYEHVKWEALIHFQLWCSRVELAFRPAPRRAHNKLGAGRS
jgi:uncharacterized protein YndB with AHSA1/START domain